jgi:hypothetical protein
MHPFLYEQTWSGGSFEILFYLGEKDAILLLEKLWSKMGFDGPYSDNKILPTNQEKLKTISNIEGGNLYGTSIIENKTVACATTTIKDEDEDGVWIYFGFPLGGLNEVYDVGAYPFEDGKNHVWTEQLAQYLREMAENLFRDVPFDGAIIGWLTAVEVDEVLQAVRSGVPEERWFWYLINDNGKLGWYPQNKQEPLMTIQP